MHSCSPTDYQRDGFLKFPFSRNHSKPTIASTKLTPQHFSNTGHIPLFTLAMIPENKMSHHQLFHLNPSMGMPFIPIQSIKPYPLSHLTDRIGNLINK
jgi:hypothetical protein